MQRVGFESDLPYGGKFLDLETYVSQFFSTPESIDSIFSPNCMHFVSQETDSPVVSNRSLYFHVHHYRIPDGRAIRTLTLSDVTAWCITTRFRSRVAIVRRSWWLVFICPVRSTSSKACPVLHRVFQSFRSHVFRRFHRPNELKNHKGYTCNCNLDQKKDGVYINSCKQRGSTYSDP